MSDALVARLEQEIATLKAENAKARERVREGKAREADLAAKFDSERTELTGKIASLTTDRDDLKGKLKAAPGEVGAENAKLKAQLQTRDHRDAFAAVVQDLHPRASIETLWGALDYKTGESIPTAEEISDLVGKARESTPYLFVTPADAAGAHGAKTETSATSALLRSPGLERGATSRNAGAFTYRKSDLQDYAWVRANSAALAEAQANGTARRLD